VNSFLEPSEHFIMLLPKLHQKFYLLAMFTIALLSVLSEPVDSEFTLRLKRGYVYLSVSLANNISHHLFLTAVHSSAPEVHVIGEQPMTYKQHGVSIE